jgi:hypothetical protein
MEIINFKSLIKILKSYARLFLTTASSVLLPGIRVIKKSNYKILGNDDGHYFVGYYDKDPISYSGKHILCHKVSPKYENMIEPKFAEVGLLRLADNNFEMLLKTNAMNWQLGSRVQWLDEKIIIYNDIIDGNQCSVKFDCNSNKRLMIYKRPFWDISKNKKYAASLNFSRIKIKRPGYGYDGSNIDGDEEVLTIFDLNDDKLIYKITVNEILDKVNFDNPDKEDIYLNHIVWSPCNKKLMTIFHYHNKKHEQKRTFPVLINIESNEIDLIYREGDFSHHTFIDQNSILAYIKRNNNWHFAIWSKNIGWTQLKDSMPELDGHPTYVKFIDKIVVDSYPNRFGIMSLYLGSPNMNEKLEKIAKIYSPPKYTGPLRCDLHPRVSIEHNFIVCDFPGKKSRKVLILDQVLNA